LDVETQLHVSEAACKGNWLPERNTW